MSTTLPPPDERQSPAPSTSARLRLHYLDGLRGLAALYVVLHHAYMEMAYRGDGGGLSPRGTELTRWLYFGQIGVDIFIVLSGYCLMLPVAKSADGGLRGGVTQFLLRRTRRILPPYYAALLLMLLVIHFFPAVSHAASPRWPGEGPHFSSRVLISHVLLLHNLSRYWVFKIDYPMWSVATEWQIYFLFPALLLPVWRRFGSIALVSVAFGLGIGLDTLFPRLDQAAPWMIGLFALGMAGAVINFSTAPMPLRLRFRMPWAALSIAFFVSLCVCAGDEHRAVHDWNYNYLLDALAGLATVCLLVYCTRHLTEHSQNKIPWPLRLLQSPVAVWIGVLSYSLYLIHAPIIALVHWAATPFHLAPGSLLIALLVCGAGTSLFLAYLFHCAFERPFTPGQPETGKQATQAAVVSPAP